MSVTAVVVAAGSGERLGAGRPKAMVPLGGEALVLHAVRALRSAATVDAVVVVAGGDRCDEVRTLLHGAGLGVHAVCAGGATRQESVDRGLAACPAGTTVVAVHDGARPLVSPALVDATVSALVEPWAAVAPGLPVVDTLKLVDPAQSDRVVRTQDRRHLWAVQTPQVFGHATLQRVHARLRGTAVTDDLALVEAAGGRVRLVPGERTNFKVTHPEDLVVAEALLAAARARGLAHGPGPGAR